MLPEQKAQGQKFVELTAEMTLLPRQRKIPSHVHAARLVTIMISENPDYSNKKNFTVLKFCAWCLFSKTFCCFDSRYQKFSSKWLNKGSLEDTGDGSMSKYKQVFYEILNMKSTNCGLKTTNHLVGYYEQIKK